jgi:hypothetical protein
VLSFNGTMTPHKPTWMMVRVPKMNYWEPELWAIDHNVDTSALKREESITSMEILKGRVFPSKIDNPIDFMDPPCQFIGTFRSDIGNMIDGELAESRASNSSRFDYMHELLIAAHASQVSIEASKPTFATQYIDDDMQRKWTWIVVSAKKAPFGRGDVVLLISIQTELLNDWMDSEPSLMIGDEIPYHIAKQSREFLGFGIGNASIITFVPAKVSRFLSACRPYFVAHHNGPLCQAKCFAIEGIRMAKPQLLPWQS